VNGLKAVCRRRAGWCDSTGVDDALGSYAGTLSRADPLDIIKSLTRNKKLLINALLNT